MGDAAWLVWDSKDSCIGVAAREFQRASSVPVLDFLCPALAPRRRDFRVCTCIAKGRAVVHLTATMHAHEKDSLGRETAEPKK